MVLFKKTQYGLAQYGFRDRQEGWVNIRNKGANGDKAIIGKRQVLLVLLQL